MSQAPAFDPTKPYTTVSPGDAPAFDPTKPFTTVAPAPAAQAKQSLLGRLHDTAFLSAGEQKAQAAEMKARGDDPNTLLGHAAYAYGNLPRDVTGVPAEIGKEMGEAAQQVGQDFKIPTNLRELQDWNRGIMVMPGVKTALDILGIPAAIPQGAATSTVGRFYEDLAGVRRQIPGTVVTLAAPGVGEAKAGGAAATTMTKAERLEKAFQSDYVGSGIVDAAQRGEHQASVKALRDAGVQLTPGQLRGGDALTSEQGLANTPYGTAWREAMRNSLRSFNQALYRKVLEPLGLKLTRTDVGHDALAAVGNQVDAEYNKLKPELRIKPNDDTLINDLSTIRNNTLMLEPQRERDVEAIINQHILPHLNSAGGIDGEVFKHIESQLTALSAQAKGNPLTQQLGNRIDDMQDALREALERNAPAGVRDRLKKLNTSWAMLRRVEEAVGNRSTSLGVASTGDVLTSVSRAARKFEGKRAFARGDALMQDMAEHAHRVLGPGLRDSGTARRLWSQDLKHQLVTPFIEKAARPIGREIIRHRTQPGRLTVAPVLRRPALRDFPRIVGSRNVKAGAAETLANQLGLPQGQP